MQLRVSDPASVPDLRQHFERSGFVTHALGADGVAIRDTSATTGHEMELHLGVWRAMHPEVSVEVLEPTP